MKAAVVRASGEPPAIVDRLTIDPDSRFDSPSHSGPGPDPDSDIGAVATAEPGPRQVRVRVDTVGPRPTDLPATRRDRPVGPSPAVVPTPAFVPHEDGVPGQPLRRDGAAHAGPSFTVHEAAPSALCPGSRQGGRVEFVAAAAHGTIPAPVVDAVPNRTRVTGSSVGTRQDLAEVVTVGTADGPHPGVPHVPPPDRVGESTDDSRSPRPTGAGTARSTRPRTPVPTRPPTCTPDDLLAAPAR
ncbi:hypothetical protein [Streptomyces sp. NPDC001422]|uniref:hypothetical protein n=1 Tax=Streptomyces sp. NPDC001422 TaxID=3364575 RepID=UPI0036CE45D8